MVSSLSLVGTTSCGKSTIGNLLCGRFILPAGVQETTTHVVDIYHDIHAHTPRLWMVDAEKNLQYETQVFVDDAEIRSCIERLMSSVDTQIPRISLRLCLILYDPGLLQQRNDLLLKVSVVGPPVLQEMRVNHGFVIRDFPGFQQHQDGPLRVIDESFDDSGLIIYTFNAEETDHTKEDQLLSVLFTLLRRRGHDWRSIIFVLNRKDAFYRDLDPGGSLRSALAARQARIKRFMDATWAQAPESATPDIIPLAAGPVFASEMLCWHDNRLASADRLFLEYQVEKLAFPLLPMDLRERLPRSPCRWAQRQWLLVYKSMRAVSGLKALVKALTTQARRLRLTHLATRRSFT